MFTDYTVSTIEAYSISNSPQGVMGSVQTKTKDFEFKGYIDYLAGQKVEIAAKYQEDTTHILMVSGSALTSTQLEELRQLNKYELHESGDIYRILDVDDLTKIGSSCVKHYEILLKYVGADQDNVR